MIAYTKQMLNSTPNKSMVVQTDITALLCHGSETYLIDSDVVVKLKQLMLLLKLNE